MIIIKNANTRGFDCVRITNICPAFSILQINYYCVTHFKTELYYEL